MGRRRRRRRRRGGSGVRRIGGWVSKNNRPYDAVLWCPTIVVHIMQCLEWHFRGVYYGLTGECLV